MFKAALFTIAKRWKQPKWPSVDDWINQMWSIHTMEYYSTIKRKEGPIHTTTNINLENIMLSERSQSPKILDCMILFTQKSRIAKSIETESRSVVT